MIEIANKVFKNSYKSKKSDISDVIALKQCLNKVFSLY